MLLALIHTQTNLHSLFSHKTAHCIVVGYSSFAVNATAAGIESAAQVHGTENSAGVFGT